MVLGKANEVEVIESTPVLCKIITKGVMSPCRVLLKIKGSADIKVFASLTNKEPDDSNCDRVFINVSFPVDLFLLEK